MQIPVTIDLFMVWATAYIFTLNNISNISKIHFDHLDFYDCRFTNRFLLSKLLHLSVDM